MQERRSSGGDGGQNENAGVAMDFDDFPNKSLP